MPQEFLTVPQTAEILQVNPHTVYNWLYTKGLPHVKLGKIVRIPRDKLDKWLEEQANGTK